MEQHQAKIVALDICVNRLPDLSGVWRTKNLKTVCRWNNYLQELITDTSGLLYLANLDVACKQITRLADFSALLLHLNNIHLVGNKIQQLLESFSHRRKLEQVDITKNPVKNVPQDTFVQGKPNNICYQVNGCTDGDF